MKRKIDFSIVFLSAMIITILFHRKALGLNLFLFEIILFLWFYISRQFRFRGIIQITCGFALLITSLFTVLTHSLFSYIINFLALFIFIGILIYPEVKSILSSMGLSFINFFNAQIQFFKELTSVTIKGFRIGEFVWNSRIFIIPALIVVFFIFIYRQSNPVFDQLLVNMNSFIYEHVTVFFKDFDSLIILTFVIGLIISSYFFLRTSNDEIVTSDLTSSDELKRMKTSNERIFGFNMISLKNEYKAGVFLLVILNLILLVLNVIDINWVWFNFEWEGQYLKQFVHEGTYLLIISVLISIALVLYFFRGNINFYPRNKPLKYLSYIWLAQNGLLTISVAIRNFYYIDYFSLAYKRIGVIIFLILTIYGLYTVLVKVHRRKSAFFLFKSNSYSFYVVLVVCSLINWDSIIANYNFKHSDKSFLHLDYLSTLADKSLPYLDRPLPELQQIDKLQKAKFSFEQKFMTPETYHQTIEDRKISFIKKWESKKILSWNLPEYLAYKKITNKEKSVASANYKR